MLQLTQLLDPEGIGPSHEALPADILVLLINFMTIMPLFGQDLNIDLIELPSLQNRRVEEDAGPGTRSLDLWHRLVIIGEAWDLADGDLLREDSLLQLLVFPSQLLKDQDHRPGSRKCVGQQKLLDVEGLGLWDHLGDPCIGARFGVLGIDEGAHVWLLDE